MNRPVITVFILTWNRKQEVVSCITSVINQTYKNIEVLVVDNCSTDGTAELIEELFPEVRVIRLDKNYGCVKGRNIGIPYANGEYVFFVDDDGLLHPNAVEFAYETFEIDERVGVVGGRVIPFYSISDINMSQIIPNDKFSLDNTFHGGVSMHKKSIYDDTGYYPDYYYGGEEQYLGIQLLKNGYFIVRNNGVVLWHKALKTSRNSLVELVNRQNNSLSNKIKYWPLNRLILELLITLFRNPYQAIKYKVGLKYFVIYPYKLFGTLKIALKMRDPLSEKLMDRYLYFKKMNVKSMNSDEIKASIEELKQWNKR